MRPFQLSLRFILPLALVIALALLDPQLVLERGYAYLTDADGDAITRTAQTRPGQSIRARLSDGQLGLTVDR